MRDLYPKQWRVLKISEQELMHGLRKSVSKVPLTGEFGKRIGSRCFSNVW